MKNISLYISILMQLSLFAVICNGDIFLKAGFLIDVPISKTSPKLKNHLEELKSMYQEILKTCPKMPDSFKVYVCPFYKENLEKRIACCSLIVAGETCPEAMSGQEKCIAEFDEYLRLLKTSRYWLNPVTLSNTEKSAGMKEAFWSIMEKASRCALQNPTLMLQLQELAIAIFSDTTMLMKLLREEKNPEKLKQFGESFLENIADKMREGEIYEDEINDIIDLLVDIKDTSRADLTGKQFIAILHHANNDYEFRKRLLKTISSKNIDLIFILSEYQKYFDILFDGSPDKFRAYLKETAKKICDSQPIELNSEEIDSLTKQAYIILSDEAKEKYGIAGIVPPCREGNIRLPKEVFIQPIYDTLIQRLKTSFLIKEIAFLDAKEMENQIYSAYSPDDTIFIENRLLKKWTELVKEKMPSFYLYLPFTVDSLSKKLILYIRLVDAKKGIIHAHSKVIMDYSDKNISSQIDTLINSFMQRLYVARLQADFRKLYREKEESGRCIEITKGSIKASDSYKLMDLKNIKGITVSRVFMQGNSKIGDKYADFHNLLFSYLSSYFKGFMDVQVNVPSEQRLFIEALNLSPDTSSLILAIKSGQELLFSLELPILPVTGMNSERYYSPYLDFICSFVEILLYDRPDYNKWKVNKIDTKSAFKDTSLCIKPLTYVPWALVPAGLPHIIRAFSAKQKWQYSLTGTFLLLGQLGTGVLWGSREMFHNYNDDNTILMKQRRYNERFFEGMICGGVIGIFQGLSVATLAHLDIREKKNIKSGYFRVQAAINTYGDKIQFAINGQF